MVLKSTGLALLAGYGLLVGSFWLFQGNLIHIPSRGVTQTPSEIGLDYQDVHLTTEDGETLHGWWIPAEDATGTLLFFHGNAGNISHRLDSLRIFHGLNQNVLIVAYRGYGDSSGRPGETGLYTDADTAMQWLRDEQELDSEEITVFGRSLGAAVASRVAQDYSVAGVILESAFTSVPDIGAELYPFLPVRLLARHEYPTERHVTEISAPLLVVHSPDDEIVPFAHGRAIYDAASDPKTFLEISGDHNSGFLVSGEQYTNGLKDFLRSIGRAE